ncbi:MAG TPA: DsbA family protein [Tepidisphaeraceae bacterium]|nr:DsbA family protein [Tepidisphaeraceae bacterium]
MMEAPLNNSEYVLSDAVTERDHALGPATASITIVEYGDYECPTCLNAVPMVQEVRQVLGERLRFVFRHFPQSSIHPHASAAAEAAEAAAEQGKFWEMHAALFKHQKELGELDLSHLALTLGLEIYQFETSRSQEKHRKHIHMDFESGKRSGVAKTPTFFINSWRYNGPNEVQSIVAAAEASTG